MQYSVDLHLLFGSVPASVREFKPYSALSGRRFGLALNACGIRYDLLTREFDKHCIVT